MSLDLVKNEPPEAVGADKASRSPIIADPIQSHWLGRRGAIAVSATISVAATIGSVHCKSLASLLVCRVIIGACLGAKSTIIAPFLGELAPFHLRGAILSSW